MAPKVSLHQSPLAWGLWYAFEFIWRPGSTKNTQIFHILTRPSKDPGPFVRTMLFHSCYQRAFRCMEYRPRIPHCNFDLANSFYGNCCISKTISARRSAEVSKSSQRNPLRFPFAWKGWKSTLSSSFIAFSEREPFLRGFLFWIFWSQRCIWVSSQCAKSFIRLARSVAICYA